LNHASDADVEVIYALNFSSWKRQAVRCCFPAKRVVFTQNANTVPAGGQLAIWSMDRRSDGVASNVKLVHLEDGFLRSVGLGADLIRPLSWVIDRQGIYYDATRPSDLENLLAQTAFGPELLTRAESLAQRIVSEGLTKYNVGSSSWQRRVDVDKIILVPGQVESDESLRYGAPKIRTNMGLLQAVRQANPNAYILYKPHPDVISGLRAVGSKEQSADHWCDEIVTDVAMGALLDEVDEVHVLTSLTGFEALLRKKSVACYGQPFYAGWGLTDDIVPISRRRRRLLLQELVAGALILYPLYMNRACDRLIGPEQALDELQDWKAKQGSALPWWREIKRIGLRRIVGVR
jgi:capsular polysaccharide export protein